jgi:hypothetical protein
MDGLPQIPQPWFQGAVAALAGFFFWILRGALGDVKKINANYITREDLAAILQARDTAHTKRMDELHADNTKNFRELREGLSGVNDKLFDLSGRIPK